MGGGVEMGKSKGRRGSALGDGDGMGGLLCGLDRHLVVRRSASWRLDLIERLRVISEYFVFFFIFFFKEDLYHCLKNAAIGSSKLFIFINRTR